MALLLDLLVSGQTRLNDDTYAKNIYADKFIRTGSSDLYVLLGGGGHKLLSDFSMSHSHPYLPLAGGTMTGAINLSSTNAKLAFGSLATSPITGYKAPSLLSNGVGIYSRYGGSSDEGAIIITEDTCVIYNSSDTGWNFQVMDKDIGTDMTNDATRSFGVNQNHQAWSLAGFVKSGSSDSYVLLGGGGHKALSDFSMAHSHPYLPLAGGTMTGSLTVKQYIFGYNYNHAGGDAPSFVFDKPGSYHTGIGANGEADTIYFSAATISNGEASWVKSYKQKWKFNGTIYQDNNAVIHSGNIGSQSVSYASSAENAHTVDGEHASAFAHIGAHNNLTASGNEFTFASSGFSGEIYINYRTAGGTNGNITNYIFGNGKGGELGTAIHSGNYNSYAPTLTGTGASGTWNISISGNAATATNAPWSGITGKPTTFTPSAHTHTASDITGLPTKLSAFTNDVGYITGITKSMVEGVLTGNITSHTHSQYLRPAKFNAMEYYSDGYCKIRINNQVSSWMLSFDVKMFRYGDYTIRFSGFNWDMSSSWDIPSASMIDGENSIEVKFGYGPTEYLWVAIPATHDTGISITNVANGFIPIDTYALDKLFTITYEAELSGTVQETITIYPPSKEGHTHTFASLTSKPTTIAGYGITDALTTSNYNSYVPTRTGTGASGTWGISISGNAATATSAGTAGNADTVDNYHASNLTKFYLSPMSSGAPADSAKSWFINTMPSASGAIVYNVPGSEKTIIAGKSSGAHGHMLQLNYSDNYLRILRYYGGSWKTTDWEKISAGYADSAGSVAWGNVTGKPSTFAPSSHSHSYLPLSGGTLNNNSMHSTLSLNATNGSADAWNKEGNAMLRFVSSNNAMVFSIGSPSNERTGFIQVGHADANNYAHVTSALHLNKLGGTVYINNNVAWHAGNDGSGSGLDADLLDGNHASAFATAGHTHNYLPLSGGTCTGNIYAPAFYESSDERLKDFYNSIDVDLDKLSSLPKKFFKWKSNPNGEFEIGTSAQELQKIYPQLVNTDDKGYLTVAYDKLSIIALRAIDKLYEMNKNLERRIQILESKH